jgi:uncharacterized peroxidase-related enzyme
LSIYCEDDRDHDGGAARGETLAGRPDPTRSLTMSRLAIIDPATAPDATKALFATAKSALGVVPNMLRVLGHSPAALGGFLGLYGGLAGSALDTATKERIALAVAEANDCNYCRAAHTAIGRGAGLSNDEMLANRRGTSGDVKAAAFVAFARALTERTGGVSAAQFEAVRAAGASDAEIVEIIAAVALNFFTNILNKATDVAIDFPRAPALAAAVAVAA